MSFVPYQVDYSVKNVSKMVGFSKKKVTFSFGFANREVLKQKLTGAACRGSEHQLTFIWSLSTGKRQLFLDGKEVHFSESGQNGWTQDRAWQHTFRLKDSTVPGLNVHFISQPVNRDVPDSRPFDLRIAGVSYFNFNQIFQLGTPSMTVRGEGSRSRANDADSDAYLSPEERRQIAQAKVESLRDIEKKNAQSQPRAHTRTPSAATTSSATTIPAGMNRDEGALICFDDPSPPPMPSAAYSAGAANPYYSQQFASSITLDPAIADDKSSPFQQTPPAYAAPPSNYGAYSANPYAPSPPEQNFQTPSYAAASPVATSGALAMYQPPAGQPTPSPYTLGPSPGGYAAAPSPGYGGSMPPQPSPSAQSFASYGSAPSFAQPPRQTPPTQPYQQQPPYQPYPQQELAGQQQQAFQTTFPYGAPPPQPPQQQSYNPYGQPPTYY